MIGHLLQAAGVLGILAMLALFIRDAEKKYRRKLAAHKQAKWDAHVEQAVKLSETPLYERIAHERARTIDTEWAQASTTGWAAP
jgi:hypothetical protein